MAENPSDSKSLRVHELRADNMKRLKHVAVTLKKGVNVIAGKNGAGKTSFLDAIVYALGGKDVHPGEVIRRGETEAQVMLDLGAFVVERRWEKNEEGGEDTTLVLREPDGARLKSPQTILDSFYNSYTFDPIAFMHEPPAKQLETMRELAGLNLGAIEGKRADLYEKRAKVNAKGKDTRARHSAMPVPPADLSKEPIDVDALLAEQNKAYTQQRENDKTRRAQNEYDYAVNQRARNVQTFIDRVQAIERDLVAAQAALEAERKLTQQAQGAADEHAEKVRALVDPDVQSIVAKISAAQATNIAISRAADREAVNAELEKLLAESQSLTAEIEVLDKQKAKLIAEAKFPVAGLGLGNMGPTFNGFALSEASSAEQLRVSVAMGFARNPRLKLMLVRNASLIDSDGMRLLEELAEQYDGQLIIEVVADSTDVGVLIEDGNVVPARVVKGGAV